MAFYSKERPSLARSTVSRLEFGVAVFSSGFIAAGVAAAGWLLTPTGETSIVIPIKTCTQIGRFPRLDLVRTRVEEPPEGLTVVTPDKQIYYEHGKFPRALHFEFDSLSDDPQNNTGLRISIYKGQLTPEMVAQQTEERRVQRTYIDKCRQSSI